MSTRRKEPRPIPDFCKHGHAMAGNLSNVGTRKNGITRCLQCHRIQNVRSAKKKERKGAVEHAEASLGPLATNEKVRQQLAADPPGVTDEVRPMNSPDVSLTVKALARKLGLHHRVVQALEKRSRFFQGDFPEAEHYSPTREELLDTLEDRRFRALRMVDDSSMMLMSAPALMKFAGEATNMIQLLKGEPTSINREQRLNLIELGPRLAKELERRGMTKTIDVEAT